MDESRQLPISTRQFSGKSVVYIMSRDQRTNDNHALIAAQKLAIKENVPLYVLFCLRVIPTRSQEHYAFMLEGLRDVERSLTKLAIPFVIRIGEPVETITSFADEVSAGALFFDFSPLRGLRALVKSVAKEFKGSVTVIDTHNVVPVWVLSDKKEFAAHTIRRKVHKNLEKYLVQPEELQPQNTPADTPKSAAEKEITSFLKDIPKSGITIEYPAGQSAALEHLQEFIKDDLANYATGRNDITTDQQSGLSPYLHFGQISSLRVALEVITNVNKPPLLFEQPKLAEASESASTYDGMNALLEEMIVRKELSDNFCFYSESYTSLDGAAAWAITSLTEHASDPRDFLYTKEQWESAATHDDAWNAAQTELLKTGKIHGYMRMYWAKKLLEWSASPEEAIQIAIYLNDKYSIDGGDPNGYVGILWSIAGVHDRPWFERSVYGKIRYMNSAGLSRKFNVTAYIKRVYS